MSNCCYPEYQISNWTCWNPCANPCVNPCVNPCANPCANPCVTPCVAPCPPIEPCPPCPTVAFIATTPVGTSIPTGSSVSLSGTPTPITSLSPNTNIGNIGINTVNGQLTVPIAGRYIITSYIDFPANATGTRESYIYSVSGVNNILTLLAYDSRNATSVGSTNISISTTANLNAFDRIYFAATQSSGTTLTTLTDSRFTIVRVC